MIYWIIRKLNLESSLWNRKSWICALKLVSPNYMQKDIALWYEIDPKVPVKIIGDLIRLRQIILNLLSNAFKFTSSGGHVRVRVDIGDLNFPLLNHQEGQDSNPSTGCNDVDINSLGQENHETRLRYSDDEFVPIKVSVTDTGIGIPEDKVGTLFQSFSQVDASTTRNFGGTGLGLTISRKLCRLMGGDMWLTSVYGEGTTFTFQVLVKKQPSNLSYGEQHKLAELTKTCSGTIVITEKPQNLIAWRSILNNTGFKFVQVIRYLEADQLFTRTSDTVSPPLLIVDIDPIDMKQLHLDITSSEDVVNHLRKRHPQLNDVPTLCVNDIRLQQPQPDNTIDNSLLVSHRELTAGIESPTVLDANRDRFCRLPTTIFKPFKNSALFSTLQQMTDSHNTPETPDTSRQHQYSKYLEGFSNANQYQQQHSFLGSDMEPQRSSLNNSMSSDHTYFLTEQRYSAQNENIQLRLPRSPTQQHCHPPHHLQLAKTIADDKNR
ncbi:hypothetical protein BCR42DRAFT_186317 [Absidia repens]|uniref:Histidine kinase domain-containing protein n=1 Tax=Absidia repens TaxID=90262 RepID=A0A1X2IRE0_9FUNG|nr:hypothetical protein BCR42DRAFT_186317 [Absidia repens]